jgi:hypothetical protein
MDFIGEDVIDIMDRIFDTDSTDETMRYYIGMQPAVPGLQDTVDQLETLAKRTPEQEMRLASVISELDRIARAEKKMVRRMRVQDLSQKEAALRAQIARLTRDRNVIRQPPGEADDDGEGEDE